MKLTPRQFRLPAAMFCLAAVLLLVLLLGHNRSSQAAEPAKTRIGSDTPVVLIVLDELPTATLMTPDGRRIDRNRYPRIAGFASGATWYRDNVAGGDFTAWAVPSILTGNLANEEILPTSKAQPDNIFTLLGPGRRVHSLEQVTELCPVQICPNGRQGEAPNVKFADAFVKAKFRHFKPAEVHDWAARIPAGKSTLSFVHIKSPHMPLRFLPSGHSYPTGELLMPNDMTLKGWTADDSAISFVQHRHLLQAGFVDRLVGHILGKIRKNGDFNRAMIILTADHGVSFDPVDLRRDATATNPGATINPPLIIKYPGQTTAVTSTASTQSIDIFPTIAAQLGAQIPATDGRPVNQAEPGRVMTVSKDRMEELQVTAEQIRRDRNGVLATQFRRLGTRGLWELGPRSHLIGRVPGRTAVLPNTRFTLDSPDLIRRADRSQKSVPALVAGRVTGLGAGRVVALSWNGRIVSTTRTFSYKNRIRVGAMAPPSVMRKGKNRLGLYLVGAGDRLRRIR